MSDATTTFPVQLACAAVLLFTGAFLFRRQVYTVLRFLSSTAHAFATEYNDVYTNTDENESESHIKEK